MPKMKDIPGWEGLYKATTNGRIYSCRRGIYLKPQITSLGYYRVQLVRNPKSKKCEFVHRLIALTFIQNPDNKPQVNHKDLNKLNNYPENLEWVTAKENIKHSCKNGRHVRGSRVTNAKLNENKVEKIRKILAIGNASQTETAQKFGVSHTTINRILKKITWKHI